MYWKQEGWILNWKVFCFTLHFKIQATNDSHKSRQNIGRIVNIRSCKIRLRIVDDIMARGIAKQNPAERISIGFGLWTSARRCLLFIWAQLSWMGCGKIKQEVAKSFPWNCLIGRPGFYKLPFFFSSSVLRRVGNYGIILFLSNSSLILIRVSRSSTRRVIPVTCISFVCGKRSV